MKEWGYTWSIFIPLVLCILIIITIVGNGLVILAWCVRRSLRTPQNAYTVSLAVADLLVGIVVIPLDLILSFEFEWTACLSMEKVRFVIVKALCTVSIFHLIGIAWDRYRTVVYELEYLRRRTMQRVMRIIGVIWILAIWIAYQPVLITQLHSGIALDVSAYGPWIIPSTVSAFVFPTFLMVFMYIEVFKAIRERLRVRRSRTFNPGVTIERDSSFEMTNETNLSSSSVTRVHTTKPLCLSRDESRQVGRRVLRQTKAKLKISLPREKKAAKTLLIIIGAFLVCWLPSCSFQFICGIMQSVTKYNNHHGTVKILEYFGHANSAINPFIYAYYNAEFRKAFRKLLRCKEKD